MPVNIPALMGWDQHSERKTYAIPPHVREWHHQTLAVGISLADSGEIPKAPPIAECVSPRGAPTCSCGRFFLVWHDV